MLHHGRAPLTRVMVRGRASEAGQGMTEYGLVLMLVAILLIVTVAVIGHQTSNTISNVATALPQ